MANKYVSFVSDEHLLLCIKQFHKSYLRAKNNISKKSFYANKVDTIKLTFDAKFNDLAEDDLIQAEILRQIDKSINNSIGTFHEQVLGGIKGYEVGNLSGFDIKATDNSLFAVFGNADLSKNISDAIFSHLAHNSSIFNRSKFYYVIMDDFSDLHEKWVIGNDEYTVSQKRVYKISIKAFYKELTGIADAYDTLYKQLPLLLDSYVSSTQQPS